MMLFSCISTFASDCTADYASYCDIDFCFSIPLFCRFKQNLRWLCGDLTTAARCGYRLVAGAERLLRSDRATRPSCRRHLSGVAAERRDPCGVTGLVHCHAAGISLGPMWAERPFQGDKLRGLSCRRHLSGGTRQGRVFPKGSNLELIIIEKPGD